MSQVFYHAVGGAPLAFCKDLKARSLTKQREFAAYSESKGGIGFTESFGFFGGVIFEDDAKRPTGFKVERRRTRDGHTFCTPEKRTAAGKALRSEFDALGRFPMSDEFAEQFAIPQILRYSKDGDQGYNGSRVLHSCGLSTSQVIWAGDDFWVVLPDIEEEILGHVRDGCVCEPANFIAPEGLERSTKARWELALAAHRVNEEGDQ